MLPELHNLKLEEEDEGVENGITGDPLPAELPQKGVDRENLAAPDDTCPLHRVVILGSAEVGKSSLIHQLMVKIVADLQAGGSGVKPVKKSSIKEKVFGL